MLSFHFRFSFGDVLYRVIRDAVPCGSLFLSQVSQLPFIPEGCVHNAHMFYIKAKTLEERTALIQYLKENDISSVFHYIPLHGAPAGQKYGRFHGEDTYTTKESERLLRLPLYYGLEEEKVLTVCEKIKEFYSK
mgnify:CR=1 FL=1